MFAERFAACGERSSANTNSNTSPTRATLMRSRTPDLLVALASTLLLAACGNGGNGFSPPLTGNGPGSASGGDSSSSSSSAGAGGTTTESVIHSFVNGSPEGWSPTGLVLGSDGNFYGTTQKGGTAGFGTVYRISPSGMGTPLYSFAGQPDGSESGNSGVYAFPNTLATLVQSSDGNFYGVTTYGGANNLGTVFKITPDGAETVLYSFGGADGQWPGAALIQGTDGNFYGTTQLGGISVNPGGGVVFGVTPAGALTVLHSFPGTSLGEGSNPTGEGLPSGALIQGTDGNFYGINCEGGANGAGTVFMITPSGAETVIYSFTSSVCGSGVHASLALGSDGNLYGTTPYGGMQGDGMVFEITTQGALMVLYSFAGGSSDGAFPVGPLIQGNDGNFYGATEYGGGTAPPSYPGGPTGLGTLFQITPTGQETVLYSFMGGTDGSYPVSGLTLGNDGHLYGTTLEGGSNNGGTVFKF